VVFREASDFYQLALLQVFIAPNQFINPYIGGSAATVINSTIGFEWAVIQLLRTLAALLRDWLRGDKVQPFG
jgi:hypothetical protein